MARSLCRVCLYREPAVADQGTADFSDPDCHMVGCLENPADVFLGNAGEWAERPSLAMKVITQKARTVLARKFKILT